VNARKILVVDDEADSRALLKSALEGRDFKVVVAARAEEALETAAREKPDLILSDVVMPYMSGLALCRRLKADRRTSAVPIVLMSGLRRADADQAGAA
jgi:CheY-like chemotaxis protein